jgi:hypothetical protein
MAAAHGLLVERISGCEVGSGANVSPRLAGALSGSWSRDTSYDPLSWCPQNSAWGQCAVTALVLQDFLGGDLMTGEVNGFHHYWNLLPTNSEVDLTLQQFDGVERIEHRKKADRAYVLSFPDTKRRYRKLLSRVQNALHSK